MSGIKKVDDKYYRTKLLLTIHWKTKEYCIGEEVHENLIPRYKDEGEFHRHQFQRSFKEKFFIIGSFVAVVALLIMVIVKASSTTQKEPQYIGDQSYSQCLNLEKRVEEIH